MKTVGTEVTVKTEDLKKKKLLSHLLTDNLKARDAIASKKLVKLVKFVNLVETLKAEENVDTVQTEDLKKYH